MTVASDSVEMSPFQTYIYKSRYARWIPASGKAGEMGEGRREDWYETVHRYIDFMSERVPEGHKDIIPELEEAILKMDVMPSMRAIMTAGKAAEKDEIAIFNPVVGTTKVITREYGNVEIQTLAEILASVVNINGEWAKASFHSYGLQPTFNVEFRLNSNSIKSVECSGKHRWLLEDGRLVATEGLKRGDKVSFIKAPKPKIDDDYVLGVRHGVVYGDGTSTASCKRVMGYMLRLCGDNRELLRFFDEYPVTYPPSFEGDPVVMMYDGFSKTHDLKHLPSSLESESYLLGFIRGWMAADGSVSKGSQVSLCVDYNGLQWLRLTSERLGFTIQHFKKQPSKTNYGKRRQDSFVVYFSRSSMISDDFLCSWKKANFRSLTSYFKVNDIVSTGESKEVFCAEVPDTNTFVLEMGLVTGNCTFVAVDDPRAFDEAMYISMCSCGLGFSVERQYINQLPIVAENFYPENGTIIKVRDSKIGWATALRQLISLLYGGLVPEWDLSGLRPKGSILKTFGGRASGPEPLDHLFKFTVQLFKNAAGRKLTSIECHDLMCMILNVVVSGGVRRSAGISLSNLSDDRMRGAKTGQWWVDNPQRALANNSAVYTEKPEMGIFMREWLSLYESKSGERGIFNRGGAQKHIASFNRRKYKDIEFGVNPCSEIILRSKEECNLTEVVVRPGDTKETLMRKVRIASILGTIQSMFTNFRYLRKEWRKNAEEERLLGVSFTGITDNKLLSSNTPELGMLLDDLRHFTVETNIEWAGKLGITPSVAVTCVKPSGTVSQLVNSSSGIHPRYSQWYLRSIREDAMSPVGAFLKAAGVPHEPDITKPGDVDIFQFPVESPSGSVMRDDLTAVQQLELYLTYQKHWAEHNVSMTVYVREDEWLDVAAWVYRHFDSLCGVSFLPFADHSYRQAPYSKLSKEEYDALAARMPEIDWSRLPEFEKNDHTTVMKEIACSNGHCEL